MPLLDTHWSSLQNPETFGALLGVALVVGLGSSLTHCAGMCAPIHFFLASRRGNAVYAYHLGRVITYSIMGLSAGWIGKGLSLTGNPASVKVAAGALAAVYVAMALHWFGIWRFAAGLERVWSRWLSGPAMKRMQVTLRGDSGGKMGLFGMGLAGGLLPCPTTQAMLIMGIGLGHPAWSALAMLALGVGTMPVFTVLAPKLVRKPSRYGKFFTYAMGFVFIVLAAQKIHGAWFQATPSCH